MEFNDFWSSFYAEDVEGVPTTFDAEFKELKTNFQRRYKNVLPLKKYLVRLSCNSRNGLLMLEEGWPFIIPGIAKWNFVGKGNMTVISVPLNKSINNITKVIPLNQFERGFTNEEIIEYANKSFRKNAST